MLHLLLRWLSERFDYAWFLRVLLPNHSSSFSHHCGNVLFSTGMITAHCLIYFSSRLLRFCWSEICNLFFDIFGSITKIIVYSTAFWKLILLLFCMNVFCCTSNYASFLALEALLPCTFLCIEDTCSLLQLEGLKALGRASLLTFYPFGMAAAVPVGTAVPAPCPEQHFHAAVHHQEEAESGGPQTIVELGGITRQGVQVG